jgi:hypothetical protein
MRICAVRTVASITRRTLGACTWLAVGAAITSTAMAANVSRQPGDPFTVALSEQFTSDTNIYRLPDDLDLSTMIAGGNASRDDLVSRTSVVMDGNWELGKQGLALNLAVDRNHYADNTLLDNTSGNGRLDWNWQVARDWSGQLGAGYGRSLASFVNSRFLGKDLLESSDYHGIVRYELTPHWSLSAKGRSARGSHDTDARSVDDFESQSSTFGVHYLTRRGDEMGLQYRRTTTTFPNEQPGGGLFSDRDYTDRAATFEMSYAFTVKTSFQGSLGYLWRHYPQSVIGDFAGPVWKMALRWEPRTRTRVEITQFQELTAYLDSESSHFEARGTRLTVGWLPSSKITLSLAASRESHDYTGFDPVGLGGAARRDRLSTWQAGLKFTPVQMLAFDVNYRFEQRDTNRLLYEYDDRVISVGLTLIF